MGGFALFVLVGPVCALTLVYFTVFFRFFEGVVKGKKDIERVGGMLVQML